MYRAKKLIVERHKKEYRETLNELLIEQGVLPRNMHAELLEIYQTRKQANE
jgi:hypothetical protein